MPELLIPHTTTELATLQEQLDRSDATIELLQEAFAELEMELDEGWTRLAGGNANEFTRTGLRKLIGLARVMYLKNPLIQRAVNVQAFYTWAQGVQIHAEDETVNEVIQRFLDDPGNKRAYSGDRHECERHHLANDGNVFFVLFPSISTGHVRVRTFRSTRSPTSSANPTTVPRCGSSSASGSRCRSTRWAASRRRRMEAYYPDWRYRPGVQVAVDRRQEGHVGLARLPREESAASRHAVRCARDVLVARLGPRVQELPRGLGVTRPVVVAVRVAAHDEEQQDAGREATRLGTHPRYEPGETNPPSTTGAAFIGDENVKMDAIPKTGAHRPAPRTGSCCGSWSRPR
jgi:hypothetical protein